MNKLTRRYGQAVKFGLFIINPLIGFLYSLRNIKSKSSYIIFFLFSFIVGISFTVPSGRTADFTGDGAVYRARFDRIASYNKVEFINLYRDYIKFDEGEKDFYATTISYLVSLFTNNYHWVFGIYAIIFGFFLLKSLHFLTKEKEFTNSIYCFLLAIIFVMSNYIFNINGVRFWTAAWIGVYSMFQIFLNKDKRYFFLAGITPFIHVSFLVYLFVLVLAYFLKKYYRFWFVMFLISFFVSGIALDLLKSVESYFPDFIARTIRLYTDAEIITKKNEATLWYVKIFQYLQILAINTTVILFHRNRMVIQKNPQTYNLYLFLMVWMTLVNFLMTIPSLGGRFLQLAIPLIAYIWLMVLDKRKYFTWMIVYFMAFLFSYLYQLRIILKVTELEFFIASPIYLIYNYLFS